MITAEQLTTALRTAGITAVTGVPCSYLTPVINRVISDPSVRYLSATQEGEAAAIAAGAWLGGGLGCVISQNSGLGNMVNPLTSLLDPARIPALLLVTWRGQPGGPPDEPQHTSMGAITTRLLDLLDLGWGMVPDDPARLTDAVAVACKDIDRGHRPYALVLTSGTVAHEELTEEPVARRFTEVHGYGGSGQVPARFTVLERLLELLPEHAAVVSTTGKTSRELFTIADRRQHFYLVGAMGSASAVGLGVALHTTRPVVVLDGDGALLMRMGSLATIAAHAPRNLVHVVLDNGVHDSTGGQRTLAGTVDIPAAAAACGYARVYRVGDLAFLPTALGDALAKPGPALVYLRIQPGSIAGLGRPTLGPAEVARRFQEFVLEGDGA